MMSIRHFQQKFKNEIGSKMGITVTKGLMYSITRNKSHVEGFWVTVQAGQMPPVSGGSCQRSHPHFLSERSSKRNSDERTNQTKTDVIR